MHCTIVEQYLAELHELVHLDGLIVVVVQLETDLGNVLNVLDLVHIKVEEKLNEGIKGEIVVILCKGDEGQDERMLLFYLINDNVFASSLPEFVVENGSRNLNKQEHIQKDEHYEVGVVRFMVLKG